MKPGLTGNPRHFWAWLKNVLDPAHVGRRYEVSYGGWNGGRFKTFWRYSTARSFALSRRESFVRILDLMEFPSGGSVKGEYIRWMKHDGQKYIQQEVTE